MAEKALRIAVHGAAGRMGSRVVSLAATDARFDVTARVFRQVPENERDPGVFSAKELPQAFSRADVLIDFSTPQASLRALALAVQAKKAAIIGTTGFSSVQKAQILALSKSAPVFLSPNFSWGIAVLGRVARELGAMLIGYDAAIVETHHKEKKDAPSGTALRLAQMLRESRPDQAAVPISSQRIGDVIGEHVLTLAGPYERIEITHRAHSRALFALGALEAAFWMRRKKTGLYGMDDLLALL